MTPGFLGMLHGPNVPFKFNESTRRQYSFRVQNCVPFFLRHQAMGKYQPTHPKKQLDNIQTCSVKCFHRTKNVRPISCYTPLHGGGRRLACGNVPLACAGYCSSRTSAAAPATNASPPPPPKATGRPGRSRQVTGFCNYRCTDPAIS